ncbi:inositol-pentakisphosphate 2-kinase-like isoform X2 [Mangifera indica]|uniref:inositol-pentakisphosphate 2-kinase-like isoform X2 n=1 Tax=Mangifera indica TaxID=29780 RepID=UPI001CF96BB5|nr:inositol-pentakisphosphate 2-kinase-like isoform X2 [Mangifera indica]
MEVKLDLKDAADWVYRGEGAVNLVLAYTGTSPAFIGKVMRIQKVPRSKTAKKQVEGVNGCSVLERHAQLVWRDNAELLLASNKETLEQLYIQHVMSPLLGPKHVDAGLRVLVTRAFLEYVQYNALCRRPASRVDAAEVDTHCDSVLLLSDHTVFPQGILNGEPCLAVEIKISELSDYDPLDLFSGSKERMSKAIKALYVTPQNNFRVFLNGSLILGGLGGATGSTNFATEKAFEDALKCVIQADDGLRTNSFIQLVSEAVYHAGIMDRLLEAQKLDYCDIEGAIHAYYNIISQPCKACKNLDEQKVSHRYSSLHCITLDESLKIVRDYLISSTAKDCSLMICFRPKGAEVSESSHNSVYLESTKQVFEYKVYFIDLDLKPLEKLEKHYEKDKKIVSCYSQKLYGTNGVNKDVAMNSCIQY